MTVKNTRVYDDLANAYVKGVTNAADLDLNLEGLVDLGTPSAADSDSMLDAQAITSVDGFDIPKASRELDSKCTFGRNVTIANATPGISVVTVIGRDYLNQLTTETITTAAGSGTGKKAFKFVDRVEVDANATIDLGFGDELGLPYTAIKLIDELVDNEVGSSGALEPWDDTAPATATTGDPRGTYDPNATMDGVKHIMANILFVNDNDHGLFGVEQV